MQDDTAKRRQTRAALTNAARAVFSEQGLSAARIEQITQRAGFTRGAFYSNFDSKEALMMATMDQERELETARISRYIEQVTHEDDSEFTLDHLTRALVEVLLLGANDRGWQLAQMEALPVALRDPALSGRQLQIRTSTEADTRLLVNQGLSRLARRPTIDLDLLVRLLLGLVDRILTDALLEDTSLDQFSRRAAHDIAALLLHASEKESA